MKIVNRLKTLISSMELEGPYFLRNSVLYVLLPMPQCKSDRMLDSGLLTLSDHLIKEKKIEIKDSGTIKRVEVINRMQGNNLFLMEGEILVKGKQDRSVTESCIIPKEASSFVSAICIEQGRNEGNEFFEAGGTLVPTSIRSQLRGTGTDQSSIWKTDLPPLFVPPLKLEFVFIQTVSA
jgi:hypothetical protein